MPCCPNIKQQLTRQLNAAMFMLLMGGGLDQFKGRKLSVCFHVLIGITHLFDRWMSYLIHC